MACTQAEFDRLTPGMGFDEVSSILGEPQRLLDSIDADVMPGLSSNRVETDLYEWRSGRILIRVLFHNGTLGDKTLIDLDEESIQE
ncbi:MAG: hypothetical protein AMXMBFR84_30270 [Candidatus Hydrogenedentota bacterium]